MYEYKELILFRGGAIRHMEVDGIRWFMVRDICEALEITWRGSETLKMCKPEWLLHSKFATEIGEREVVLCTERGVLSIALSHSTPFHQEFIDFFYDRLLPVVRAQQKLPLLPPPTIEERLNSVVSALPVSVGKKHPGRVIGMHNRSLVHRIQRWCGQIISLQERIETALSLLQSLNK